MSKRTGEETYVLRHNLNVYGQEGQVSPMVIEGFFLIGSRGNITQVRPDRELHWVVEAHQLVDELQMSWRVSQ